MSHSKRNTSLAFFTSHERSLLRTHWGSQSTRLTRDSFLPFGSCSLCLLPAQDPVACSGCLPSGTNTTTNTSSSTSTPTSTVNNEDASNGSKKRKREGQRKQAHLYCRECILSNLLTQRKEAKRLENVSVGRRREEEDAERRAEDEAHVRAVRDFENVQAGLDTKLKQSRGGGGGGEVRRNIVGRENGKVIVEEVVAAGPGADGKDGEAGSKKRKFELDEEELVRIAKEERSGARRRIEEERDAARRDLPSFWLPATAVTSTTTTTTTGQGNGDQAAKKEKEKEKKHTPLCPGSTPTTPHAISLKTLIPVNFSNPNSSTPSTKSIKDATMNPTEAKTHTCPSCSRALTNASKAVLASTCGHVVCGQCADKFMSGDEGVDPHADESEPVVTCYVCGSDVGGGGGGSGVGGGSGTQKGKEKGKQKKGKKDGSGGGGELLEIMCEGTGFAGGGRNVVSREGVAFQC